MKYYYFPNEFICRKLFFFCYSCVLLDSEYVLHFVSSLINFRAFSASKFVLCQFSVLKSLECQELFFFFRKKSNFFQVKFFYIQKIIFVFEIVHCAVFLLWFEASEAFTLGKGRVHFMSFEFIFNPLISMLQIILLPFL